MTSCPRTAACALALLACVGALGCSDGLNTAEVSGRITFQGQPLVGAAIATQPIAKEDRNPGPGSFGETDAEGRYQLELVKPAKPGAIVGEHRVLITPQADAPDKDIYSEAADAWSDDPRGNVRPQQRRWPKRFQDGSLRLTVPAAGRTDADFEL